MCYSFNEDTFTIYDITDPSKPSIISATFYHGVSYSHQGWVVDEKDQSYLLMNDELDEMFSRGSFCLYSYDPRLMHFGLGWAVDQKTITFIWDIKDLSRPVLTGHWESPVRAIDHNLYVHVRASISLMIMFSDGMGTEQPRLPEQLQERAPHR